MTQNDEIFQIHIYRNEILCSFKLGITQVNMHSESSVEQDDE